MGSVSDEPLIPPPPDDDPTEPAAPPPVTPPAAATPPPSAAPPSRPTTPIRITRIAPRAVFTVVGILITVGAGLWLLRETKQIITWVLIAAFLALALNPAVDLFQRRLRMRRVPAISLTYLVGLVFAAGVSLLLVPPLITAGQQLADDAPGYVDRLSRTKLVMELDERYNVVDRLREFVNDLPDRLGGAGAAVDVAQTVFQGILGGLTVLVLTFLLLIYGRQMRDQMVLLMPGDQQSRYRTLIRRMYRTVGGYVAGSLTVAVISGVLALILLTILQIPSAAALAFWVALAGLIPLVGATIGAIPAVIVAFFQGWVPGVICAGYFLLYQQAENHFVQPTIMKRTTSINPLVVLIAVLVGASLFGIFGALVAIPLAGMIKIALQDWWQNRTGQPPPPVEIAVPPAAAAATDPPATS